MKRGEAGNTIVEFTLIGIPLIFVLISTFEMARGMWIYHTMAYAMKEATRFAAVKGQNCSVPPNACSTTVDRIAQEISASALGLIPGELNVTLSSPNATITCNPLSSCAGNATVWPTDAPGADVQVTGIYPFRSALSMLWPGSPGVVFGTVQFSAYSKEKIHF